MHAIGTSIDDMIRERTIKKKEAAAFSRYQPVDGFCQKSVIFSELLGVALNPLQFSEATEEIPKELGP